MFNSIASSNALFFSLMSCSFLFSSINLSFSSISISRSLSSMCLFCLDMAEAVSMEPNFSSIFLSLCAKSMILSSTSFSFLRLATEASSIAANLLLISFSFCVKSKTLSSTCLSFLLRATEASSIRASLLLMYCSFCAKSMAFSSISFSFLSLSSSATLIASNLLLISRSLSSFFILSSLFFSFSCTSRAFRLSILATTSSSSCLRSAASFSLISLSFCLLRRSASSKAIHFSSISISFALSCFLSVAIDAVTDGASGSAADPFPFPFNIAIAFCTERADNCSISSWFVIDADTGALLLLLLTLLELDDIDFRLLLELVVLLLISRS
mmetsp:Transcript_13799/g.28088  ORF Transcript_13799/g.28088 Transcript_13799/m.28088 type:complete len:327 (+) Transcript_13799:914-1894(+)